MATSPSILMTSSFDLTTDFLEMYETASNQSRTIIDAVNFNNYSSANVTISIRIIQSGLLSAGDVLDELTTDAEIRAGESYLAPEVIGQAIQRGGIIAAKASANSSVNVNMTGTTIT